MTFVTFSYIPTFRRTDETLMRRPDIEATHVDGANWHPPWPVKTTNANSRGKERKGGPKAVNSIPTLDTRAKRLTMPSAARSSSEDAQDAVSKTKVKKAHSSVDYTTTALPAGFSLESMGESPHGTRVSRQQGGGSRTSKMRIRASY